MLFTVQIYVIYLEKLTFTKRTFGSVRVRFVNIVCAKQKKYLCGKAATEVLFDTRFGVFASKSYFVIFATPVLIAASATAFATAS